MTGNVGRSAPGPTDSPVTLHVRALCDAARQADDSYDASTSRWWRRRADQRRFDARDRRDGAVIGSRRALVAESVARLSPPPGAPSWGRPSAELVREDVRRAVGFSVPLPDAWLMRAIHGGYELEAVQADLEVVREAFQDAGDRAAELMQSHDTTSKPSTSWVRTEPTPTEAAIIRFIQSPLGQLRRPVTVWRGESPSTHRTSFTAAARELSPGTY